MRHTTNGKKKLRNIGFASGSLLLGFLLMFLFFFPIFGDKTLYDNWFSSEKPQDISPVADETVEPYLWVEHNYPGGISRWEVNKTFVKDFLKDNFKWRLQASSDNSTWYDADSLLDINLGWVDENNSYKVTLTLDTTGAPKGLFYRFDLGVNKDLKEYMEVDGWEWRLTLPTGNSSRDVTVFFNWSDIQSLVESGKVWFDRGVKNGLFWFRVQTVNKIAVGKTFVVDPYYGVIPAAVTDSWEWDPQEGRVRGDNTLLRMGTSNYFISCASGDTGTDGDGWLRVFQVNDTGTIKDDALIDSWEYNTVDGAYSNMLYLGNDIYAVIVYDVATTVKGKIITTTAWSNNGTLKRDTIGTYSTARTVDNYPSIVHVNGNIYAVVYNEYASDYDHQLETIWINSSGTINTSACASLEFDSTGYSEAVYNNPSAIMVDSDTIAIAYSYLAGTAFSLVKTYDIDGSGTISAVKDTWNIGGTWGYINIHSVTDNVFVVGYAQNTTKSLINTTIIDDDGLITENVDSLVFFADDCAYINIFTVADATVYNPGVYGITYSEGSSSIDGWLVTVNITSAGAIDSAIIDSLEYDASNSYLASTQHVSGDFYVIQYSEGANLDGWICTVNITTPSETGVSNDPPVLSNENPLNNSIDVAVDIGSLNITIEDPDGDTFNYSWACSDGSYNSASGNTNGSKTFMLNMGDLSYSTVYTWWVNATDSEGDWVNSTFSFTTVAGGEPTASFKPTLWHNMSFSNTSSYQSSLWYNISFSNSTFIWRTPLYYNFSFSNQSFIWRTPLYYNFSFSNSTYIWRSPLYYNFSFSNSTFLWKQPVGWNMSFGNSTAISYQPVLWHNMSFSNSTAKTYQSSLWYNISFSNSTYIWRSPLYYNFSFSNTSNYKTSLWHNMSFSNTSSSATLSWNMSFSNSTIGIITLSNPYPPDTQTKVIMDVILNITITHYNGSMMNLTWYWGNSTSNCSNYLGSTLNIYNGTYHMHLSNASIKNESFYWSVNASDSYIWENETYVFTTGHIKSGTIQPRDNALVIGLIIGFMLCFYMIYLVFRRKRYEET